MSEVGVMAMPANFRYREVFLKGKPRHDRCDPFRIKHPSMDLGKRAKIFAPFDALKGFKEAVAAKDILYEDRIIPGREDIYSCYAKKRFIPESGEESSADRLLTYTPYNDYN